MSGETHEWLVPLYKRGCCFSGGSVVQNPPASAGDVGLIPGSGRSSGEGNGNPIHYCCLGKLMDSEACWATVHGVISIRHNWVTKQQKGFQRLHHVNTERSYDHREHSYDRGGELSREHGHSEALILDFPAYRIVRNKFMVFISHQICSMLLLQPKWTKISPLLPIDSYTWDTLLQLLFNTLL